MDETVHAKIKEYCSRNILLDQLSENSMEEMKKRRKLSLEHEELGEIYNAYALVNPLRNTLWSTFLYQFKDCDTKYQNQAIYRCLSRGMLETICTCKTDLLLVQYTTRFAVIELTETCTNEMTTTN